MSIIGKGLKVLGTFCLAGSLLLGSSAASAAYFFSYQGFQNLEGNVNVAASPESFLITDFYDDGNEMFWEIVSVYEDEQGGVVVEYAEEGGGEHVSFHGVSGTFQILRADGNTTSERIYVDAWGTIEFKNEQVGGVRWRKFGFSKTSKT